MNAKGLKYSKNLSMAIEYQSAERKMLSFNDYPVREGSLTEMDYTQSETIFSLWSPFADEVKVSLYESGHEGSAYRIIPMIKDKDGTWQIKVQEDLNGRIFRVCKKNLEEDSNCHQAFITQLFL